MKAIASMPQMVHGVGGGGGGGGGAAHAVVQSWQLHDLSHDVMLRSIG